MNPGSVGALPLDSLHGAGTLSLLFITGCLFDKSSGPYLSLKQTVDALHQRGHHTTILGTKPTRNDQPTEWAGEVHSFQRFGPASAHYAPRLAHWLEQQPARWDVVSLQGIWMHINHPAADWSSRHDVPFMITTHGQLNPAALQISAWKKNLARMTFLRPVFDRVRCYQALTEVEYRILREHGIRGPVCIIGNGIVLPDISRLPPTENLLPHELRQRRTVLYLGRLFPIKGIDRLLRAWSKVRLSDEWQLVIAGDGAASYRASLEHLAETSNCRNVHFVGYVSGDLKSAWLRQADIFVLPSHSEAFPMAVLEAFSYGKPALLTAACGLLEAANAGAALEVPSTEAGICDGLSQLGSMSYYDLKDMGYKALTLVRDRYDWGVICSHLDSVYHWMTGSTQRPSCLRYD